jgi:hypothetical protein
MTETGLRDLFIEHIRDEFIHHTAEIALLRDLYRYTRDGDG